MPKLLDEKPKSYRQTGYRWLALALVILSLLGCFYCSNNPQALETQFESDPYNLSKSEYNLLYSVYAAPTIVFNIIGGVLCDRIGIRASLIIFSVIVVVGQGLFVLGIIGNQFWLMLVGRSISGIGTDCITIAMSAFISKWFKSKELAFALSVAFTATSLLSSTNSYFTPALYSLTKEAWIPCFVGWIMCAVSIFLCGVLSRMDRVSDAREEALVAANDQSEEAPTAEETKFSFGMLRDFKPMFWYLLLSYGLCQVTFGCFTNQANSFLQKRFGLNQEQAGAIIPFTSLVASIVSPFFGLLTDKIGKRTIVLLASNVFLILAHALLTFLPDYNGSYICVLPMFLFGVFLATNVPVFLSCIPLIQEKHLGLAFAINASFVGLVATVVPYLVGKVQEATIEIKNGYYWSEFMLLGLSLIGSAFTIMLFISDQVNGKILMKVVAKPDNSVKPEESVDQSSDRHHSATVI